MKLLKTSKSNGNFHYAADVKNDFEFFCIFDIAHGFLQLARLDN